MNQELVKRSEEYGGWATLFIDVYELRDELEEKDPFGCDDHELVNLLIEIVCAYKESK